MRTLPAFLRALSDRRLTCLALGLGLGLGLGTLRVGRLFDDYLHQLRLQGRVQPELAWSLYDFSPTPELVEHGPFPWWALPELKIRFLRPLSVALLHLDAEVFGFDRLWAHHLHSVLWYLALLGAALLVYRLVLPPRVAAVALLLFAIAGSHVTPVAWLANRHALVSTALAVAALWLHLRWRRQRWRPGLPLAMLAFATALAGGESALALWGYLVAHEALAATDGWRARLAALAPLGAVTAAWAVLYRAVGAGAWGSAIYIDPLREPAAFWLNAPGRGLALLGSLSLGVTSDAWLFFDSGRWGLMAAGLLGAGLFGWLLRFRLREVEGAPAVGWLTVGAVVSLLPSLATFPADRLLMMASLGGAAAVAFSLVGLWPSPRRSARALKALLVAVHLVAPLVTWAVVPAVLARADVALREGALTRAPEQMVGRVVLPLAPDPSMALYAGAMRFSVGKALPVAWHSWSFAPFAHRLTRVGPQAFELQVIGGQMMGTVFEQLVRAERYRLAAGDVVRNADFTVTVLEATGGRVGRVRVDLQLPVEQYDFMQWQAGRLVPLEVPVLGQSVVLPHTAGPFEQMFGG